LVDLEAAQPLCFRQLPPGHPPCAAGDKRAGHLVEDGWSKGAEGAAGIAVRPKCVWLFTSYLGANVTKN